MKGYTTYNTIHRELLDSIEVNDLVKINDWKLSYRVRAVSENYFIMTRAVFGQTSYSVCEKKPWDGFRHNDMLGGAFHCGPDDYIFGSLIFETNEDYKNPEKLKAYLDEFEEGKTQLSVRRSCRIRQMAVKKA